MKFGGVEAPVEFVPAGGRGGCWLSVSVVGAGALPLVSESEVSLPDTEVTGRFVPMAASLHPTNIPADNTTKAAVTRCCNRLLFEFRKLRRPFFIPVTDLYMKAHRVPDIKYLVSKLRPHNGVSSRFKKWHLASEPPGRSVMFR